MKILSIDTSCDESCAAIVDTQSWKLLADVVQSHIEPMAPYGGIVPELASREHVKALPVVVDEALRQAQLTLADLDWVTVTNRPGLMGSLMVGVSYAKALAYSLKKPITFMNHIEGHLFSPILCTLEGEEVPKFPWIALVVSGGHTELFKVTGPLEYEWIGGTLDDAAGEAFDKVGKLLSLPYPAGPFMDKWAREEASDSDRVAYQFPRSKVKDYHYSFSGFKTNVLQTIQKIGKLNDKQSLQVVASAQEAILEALIYQVKKAQTDFDISQVVVTGGVACNSRFRELLSSAYFPKRKHCTDNAAMIGVLSAIYASENKLKPSRWEECPRPMVAL